MNIDIEHFKKWRWRNIWNRREVKQAWQTNYDSKT